MGRENQAQKLKERWTVGATLAVALELQLLDRKIRQC